MTKVLLVCNAGLSTRILAKKMEMIRPGLTVAACSDLDCAPLAADHDVMLIGPQIRHKAADIRAAVDIPLMVIDTNRYATMDAAGILQDADTLLRQAD